MRRWQLDYKARWKFWKVSGVCDNRLIMTTDSNKGTVSPEQNSVSCWEGQVILVACGDGPPTATGRS